MKKHTLVWYKKKLWSLVSKYVRLSYADENGNCKCYTCGREFHWKQIQSGHGFSGRKNAFLFELAIIRPQCYGCNICNSGKLDVFAHNLRQEHGITRYEELWALKDKQRKFSIPELEEMIIEYKGKVKAYEA